MTGSGIAPIWQKIGQAASGAGAPQQCRCSRHCSSQQFQSLPGKGPDPCLQQHGQLTGGSRPSPGRRSREASALTRITSPVAPEPRAAFDRISLRRLVSIRWVAVIGQALALLVVHYVLEFPLPLLPAFSVVASSAALNLFFAFHHRAATRLGERQARDFLGCPLFYPRPAVLRFRRGR